MLSPSMLQDFGDLLGFESDGSVVNSVDLECVKETGGGGEGVVSLFSTSRPSRNGSPPLDGVEETHVLREDNQVRLDSMVVDVALETTKTQESVQREKEKIRR